MVILLQKLEKLLNINMFIIDTLFIFKLKCVYIRVISIKTGDVFLIYVDPSFNFNVTEEFKGRSLFKISLIEINIGDTVVEKYSEYPTTKTLEDRYKRTIQVQPEISKQKMENILESKYCYKISLDKVSNSNIKTIRSCIIQLRRISLSFQDLRYKISIFKGSYMCASSFKDESARCYEINGYMSDNTCFYVVVGLEYFYSNLHNIQSDISTIKHTLYDLLDTNYDTCSQSITTLLKELSSSSSSVNIKQKKDEIDESIEKNTALLSETIFYELEYLKKYEDLEENKPADSVYVHTKKHLFDKITEIQTTKKKLITSLVKLKTTKDNLYFTVDQIQFDNTVMIDEIINKTKMILKFQ